MSDDQQLEEFPGTARLFPLPNLVLFPHVVQPLHVFEPRYRELTTDALCEDRFIAVVLLKPGWEDLYHGKPALHKYGCLGRVIAEQKLQDGRFNILLRGMKRVRLRREMDTEKLYRVAKADLLDDNPPDDVATASALRRELADTLLPRFTDQGSAKDQVTELFHGEMPLGALCDVLSFALPFPPEMKQCLLEQLDVPRRVRQLMDLIEGLRPDAPNLLHQPGRKFPPDFSLN